MTEPQFGILGPLTAAVDDCPLEVGGPRPRRLLAMLLLHVGTTVSVGRLVEAVWERDPPPGAETTLRSHVANVRRRLLAAGAEDVVVTRPPGYSLRVVPEQVDAHRFQRIVEDGRAALARDEPEHAARLLRGALGLWRGGVLEDLGAPRFAEADATRLDELRLVALGARIEADLALGRHQELVGELKTLVAAHPFREQSWGQFMLALYRSGRQADALGAYQAARRRFGEESGLDPGQDMADLEAAILRQDPSLLLASGVRARTPRHDEARSPTPASPPALLDVVRRIPMVGREDELGRLRDLWVATRTDGRGIALVSGEAGVGKTRLVAELTTLATEDAATVLIGYCEQAPLVPYQPVTDALLTSQQAADAFARAPQQLRDRLAPLMDPQAGPRRLEPGSDDREEQRTAFREAVGELLARMSDRTPVVFVVEDAESIDQASSRLLRHLARRLPQRMLLLVCFRDPPGSRHPPLLELLAELEGRGVADRVALRPLAEPDLAALVATWTGAEATAEFVHTLWSTTGGNPFYASEVVRDLVARGGIDRTDDAWRVPTGVRDVLRARLHMLSEVGQEVVGCAAVVGREVDVDLLMDVVDQPTDRVVDGLDEALRAGWLVESNRSWKVSYAFPHALMHQAVHTDLSSPRRQHLHLRAADALEAAGPRGPTDMAAVAAHLRAAGSLADRGRTAAVSLQAADQSVDVHAWDEAVGHADAAVAILEHAGLPHAQQGDAALRAGLIRLRATTGYRRAIDHFEAALGHYRAAGDETGVAQVHGHLGQVLSIHHGVMDIPRAMDHFAAAEPRLTDGPAAFDVRHGKAMAAMFGLRTDEGCAASQRAVAIAEELGRPDLAGRARPTLATHRVHRGEIELARTIIDEAWATAQDLGDPHLVWDTVTSGAMTSTMYLLDPRAGKTWCRRGLAQPGFGTMVGAHQALSDQLAHALASMGDLRAAQETAARLADDAVSQRLLLRLQGEWEAAEESWATALAHDLDHGDRLNAALNGYWLGQVRWLLGRDVDALDALRDALAIGVDGPHVPVELMVRAELARILAADGDVSQAALHLAHCEAIIGTGEDWRGQVGTVDLARGAVAAAQGHHELADAAHDRALDAFATYQLPWERAEALQVWAKWLASAGRSDEAEATHRDAMAAYEELGASNRWRRPLAWA